MERDLADPGPPACHACGAEVEPDRRRCPRCRTWLSTRAQRRRRVLLLASLLTFSALAVFLLIHFEISPAIPLAITLTFAWIFVRAHHSRQQREIRRGDWD